MQEPQENPKFSVKEFATQLKSQRPEYADIDDLELVKNGCGQISTILESSIIRRT